MYVEAVKHPVPLRDRIRREEIDKYLDKGKDFVPLDEITALLASEPRPDAAQVRDILAKALAIENLTPQETATLLRVEDASLLEEMRSTALQVKKKVYDNRIVTFAPLYLGNFCVNNCVYCGFKADNRDLPRRVLNETEIRREVEVLAGKIGHKRLVAVYGEHPRNDVDYILSSLREIYDVSVEVRGRRVGIRRVNVNAPPFAIEDLRAIKEAGIGTYQVFQETYHRPTYERVHPQGTLKGDYRWRLYAMHRALEAGIDDVGIGVLFGLYDWRFEILGLVSHAADLEKRFGIGPHTVSFPRLEPALNAPLTRNSPFLVSDDEFLKLLTVIRLAIPYVGMIITARENADIRRRSLDRGITQTDASSQIEVGSYQEALGQGQSAQRQQFLLGDTRSLDEVIREFARMGYISSFCTAGYRCSRTGKCIMDLLRSGREGQFCKLNAVLTFREWLDDFASEETKAIAQPVLQREIDEINRKLPQLSDLFNRYYQRIQNGERDLFV